MGFSLDDYVDVAERIAKFYEEHPEGALTTQEWSMVNSEAGVFVFVHARAWRSPDDELPGDGYAWEPFPGKTPYTKDSELMNAQTAAWGRAIVATGILASKKIASKQEVKARQGDGQKNSTPADLPERYVDWLRLAIRGYNQHELSDEVEWRKLVDAASTKEKNAQLVKSLEAALVEVGGDVERVKNRWLEARKEKAGA